MFESRQLFTFFLAVWAFVSLIGAATEAHADASGLACVKDAQTIAISAKRQSEDCHGGTPVRLYGILAPGVKQSCKAKDGREFFCGRYAAKLLLDKVQGRRIYCKGNSQDGEGRLIAVCRVAGEDLGEWIVREGWAYAFLEMSQKYRAVHEDAKLAQRGLWDMKSVQDPNAWRAEHEE